MLAIVSIVYFSLLLCAGLAVISAMLIENADRIFDALGIETLNGVMPLPPRVVVRERPACVILSKPAFSEMRAAA